MDASAWESAFREELELSLFNADSSHRGMAETVDVTAVHLEGAYPDTEVVILFRDRHRPDCMYGFRWGRIWDWLARNRQTPQTLAHIVWANLEEASLELPECEQSGSVTWIE